MNLERAHGVTAMESEWGTPSEADRERPEGLVSKLPGVYAWNAQSPANGSRGPHFSGSQGMAKLGKKAAASCRAEEAAETRLGGQGETAIGDAVPPYPVAWLLH